MYKEFIHPFNINEKLDNVFACCGNRKICVGRKQFVVIHHVMVNVIELRS